MPLVMFKPKLKVGWPVGSQHYAPSLLVAAAFAKLSCISLHVIGPLRYL